MADNFNVWLAKPSWWVKKDARVFQGYKILGKYEEGDAPRKVAGPFVEPAEAADVAEDVLKKYGVAGQSWCELRYNGDSEPHTMIFLLENDVFGVWNTGSARWPLYYPTPEYGQMIDGWPEGFDPEDDEIERGLSESGESESGESDKKGDRNEEADVTDLSDVDGMDDDEDDFSDDEEDDDLTEDDEADIEADDDDAEDDAESEPEEDFNDESEDEDDEEDEEDGEDEKDDEDSDELSDDDPGNSSDDEDEGAEEDAEEPEMPRLNIFAKMRGPKGWRKRADAEELLVKNLFGFKVGVLDPDEDLKPSQREKNVRVAVEFIEHDENRREGTLRLKLPKGITPDDFTMAKSGWMTVEVPYYDPEED